MTGPQLRIIRECAGISQLALGKMLGISQTWVSRYERGLSFIPELMAERVAMLLPKPTLEAQKVKEEEIRAREQWQKKTDAYLKTNRGRPRKESVEKGDPESTDREVMSISSTRPVPPVEVRLCSTVELGPETMKALKDLIETAVREMKAEAINPEVIQAAKEGAEYRRKTQAILGRGW